jgi:NAD(P)H-dependent FMN reductase
MTHIVVLHGTRRIGNLSIHVARFLEGQLNAQPDVTAQLVSLMDYNVPILEERVPTVPIPDVQAIAKALAAADGVLIVSPEYKNSLPGALKNLLDHLPAAHFKHKAVGIATVSSGGFGGLNCLAHLRLIVTAMAGLPIPERFPVSMVQDQFDAEGKPVDAAALADKAKRFLEDLLWHVRALPKG